ncbi:hypothetical protein AURDEDRAFT_160782 [Auricularia subglabra TFB-10046 SS5]|nr:hypothetical protein AURDEDRAFT_160782 [Auricularia subglabra TFB-10046 SS5]
MFGVQSEIPAAIYTQLPAQVAVPPEHGHEIAAEQPQSHYAPLVGPNDPHPGQIYAIAGEQPQSHYAPLVVTNEQHLGQLQMFGMQSEIPAAVLDAQTEATTVHQFSHTGGFPERVQGGAFRQLPDWPPSMPQGQQYSGQQHMLAAPSVDYSAEPPFSGAVVPHLPREPAPEPPVAQRFRTELAYQRPPAVTSNVIYQPQPDVTARANSSAMRQFSNAMHHQIPQAGSPNRPPHRFAVPQSRLEPAFGPVVTQPISVGRGHTLVLDQSGIQVPQTLQYSALGQQPADQQAAVISPESFVIRGNNAVTSPISASREERARRYRIEAPQPDTERSSNYPRRPQEPPPPVIGFKRPHKREPKDAPTNALHLRVRAVMNELLNFGDKKCFRRPHPPADLPAIAAFLRGGRGPDIRDLRLDLVTTASGIKSHWNIAAANQFADEFIRRERSAHFPPGEMDPKAVNNDNIRDLFLKKIRYFMSRYQKLYFPIGPDHDRLMRALSRINGRRSSLHYLRTRVCTSHDIIADFLPVMEAIDDEMISEDETDTELTRPRLKVVRRIERVWVNPEITRILHTLIDVHLGQLNPYGEITAGNQFRQRINHPPARVTDTGVVVGLPRNFYNPRWLRTLSEDEFAALQTRRPIDLRPFLARISRIRRCCEGTAQRIG